MLNPIAWLRARQERIRLIHLDNAEAEARRRHDHEAVLRVVEGE